LHQSVVDVYEQCKDVHAHMLSSLRWGFCTSVLSLYCSCRGVWLTISQWKHCADSQWCSVGTFWQCLWLHMTAPSQLYGGVPAIECFLHKA